MNYSTLVQSFMNNNVNIKSLAHITGGGLIDNVPRVLPNNLSLDININSWKKLPIFEFLSNALDIEKGGFIPNIQHGYWSSYSG
jgi:phosphoribosylformylglycinamidine cyclo-ligase